MKNILVIFSLCLPLFGISQKALTEEVNGFLSYNEQKVLSLAEAFTDEQYDWRPAEGIRSVGESLLHLASANYFFMMSSGFPPPEEVDVMSMETTIKGKENVIEAVKKSYSFLKEHIGKMSVESLGDEVKLPFEGEFTKQTALILSVDHCSEHLGQLIAYARSNGIVPPWSQPQEENKE